jgi:hypothetical protein
MKKLFAIAIIAAQLITNDTHGLLQNLQLCVNSRDFITPFWGTELSSEILEEIYPNYRHHLQSITIPASVQIIRSECFKNCPLLTNVIFEKNSQLTTLEANAFENCPQLQSITIPASVKTIGIWCFWYCTGLTNVNFKNNSQLARLEAETFCNCFQLQSITIPARVKVIGEMCFLGCNNLTNVNFEKNSRLTTLENSAFKDCVHLPSIIIPAKVKTIGKECFAECYKMADIHFSNTFPIKIAPTAFRNCSWKLRNNPAVRYLIHITI